MDSDVKDTRHFLKRAGGIAEASCFGRYMGVGVEKVLVSVPITGHYYDERRTGKFTLVRVLFSNIWDHRIEIWTHQMKMIDTEGIQHSHEADDLHIYQSETEVKITPRQKVPYTFASYENPTTLEGKAKMRGWLWFPGLPLGIYPYRLIFNFEIFAPGYTSGAVEDHETLEVVFDFKFRELLPSANSFTTLEIENV